MGADQHEPHRDPAGCGPGELRIVSRARFLAFVDDGDVGTDHPLGHEHVEIADTARKDDTMPT